MQPLGIALLQMDLAWHDPVANRERAGALMAQVPQGTHLIVLPEMFTTGFSMQATSLAEGADGRTLQWMRLMAAQYNAIVAGSIVYGVGSNVTNRFVAMSATGEVCHYDKRHLFRMANEHEHYAAGMQRLTFEVRGWRIRPLVCYDLRFPVWCRNDLSGAGLATDLMLFVANWPQARVSHWKLLLQARAVENQCWVAGVNRVGSDGNNINYSGDSMIVDPLGNVEAHNTGGELVLFKVLDPEPMLAYREKFPAWRDADAFTL